MQISILQLILVKLDPMPMLSNAPILWSFRRCPFAMRARLAIAVSGQIVQLREILLRDKPAAFLATSAKGTVPVLDLRDGMVIEESRDIMMWALGANDPDGWLDIWQKQPDKVKTFLDNVDGPFKHDLDRYKYASRYEVSAARQHRENGAQFLTELDQSLGQLALYPVMVWVFWILPSYPLFASFVSLILSGLMRSHGRTFTAGCRNFWVQQRFYGLC